MVWSVGVDLGATNLRIAIAGASGEVIAERRLPTTQGPDGDAITAALLEEVGSLCLEVGLTAEEIVGVGIATFGPLDMQQGAVVTPPNLAYPIEQIDLLAPFSSQYPEAEVYVLNDATAGVIGERFHAPTNPDNMVYLTISSGIGAGVCVDGTVLRGWDANAGEIGHIIVDPTQALPCGCGGAGHWESYASGEAIPRYAHHLAETTDHQTDMQVDTVDAAGVFAAASEADPLAAAVLEGVTRWNRIGIETIIRAYAPFIISIGGSVALQNPEAVVAPVRAAIERAPITTVPDIRLSPLGNEAPLQGAIAAAITGGTGDRRRLE
jgi:glucokinase